MGRVPMECVLVRVQGSHHQFRHPVGKGLVPSAVDGGRGVPPRDLRSIKRQSGVREERLLFPQPSRPLDAP